MINDSSSKTVMQRNPQSQMTKINNHYNYDAPRNPQSMMQPSNETTYQRRNTYAPNKRRPMDYDLVDSDTEEEEDEDLDYY